MILDFQDQGAVVLTTQEPGAFLNFRWEPGDISSWIQPSVTSDVSAGILWVNGLDISEEASIYSDPSIATALLIGADGDPSTASFLLYTRELGPFDAKLQFNYIGNLSTDISSNLYSWANYGLTALYSTGSIISQGASNTGGGMAASNIVSATGGLTLNVSFLYENQGTPGQECVLRVSEYMPPLTLLADSSIQCTDPTITSPGTINSISINLDPSTESLIFWFEAPPTGFTQFGANSWSISEDSSNYSFTADVSVLNRPYVVSSDSINTFETSNVQVEGDTSYLILRTNPKFSGNIKLTIDPSNNLFMDTFKVSDILSNKLYRKQAVSASSVMSGDIRRVYSSLPLGEMYRVDAENTLNIAIPKTDLYKQYNLTYSYGARLFEDELYEEDYAMLAPLWVNNKLPDYFAIFRLPGVFNEETYDEEPDLTNLAERFLQEGELMESWGIKEGSPLGTYLRNHLDELQKVISPMFLSLSDPTLKDPDPNTWYGTAVDKGIITGRSETTYFFDQKSDNFTDLNAFSSQGFERLNLLCPNLINMEYAFNDTDVSLYTMQRYFGLYLTENPLYEIAYYADSPDASINIISLDGKDSEEFFNSSIFDGDGSIMVQYQNRIFTLDDLLSIQRITNVHQVDGTEKDYIEEWLNKPGENIFSIKVKNIDDLLPFISFELKNTLAPGEHLRIVDNTQNIIWEVYGIDIDLLEAGESWTYATEYSEPGYPKIYRTMFSVKGTKEDQNTAIWNAWNVFQDYQGTPFRTFVKKREGQSIVIEDWAYGNDIKFQRLTAQTTDTPGPSSLFNAAADYSDIEFYGTLSPTEEDFERIAADASFGPINFELYGDRMSITVDLFDPANYSVYSMDASIVDLFQDNMLYLAPDSWYRLVQYFDVSTAINHSLRYADDPTSSGNNLIVITEDPIITVDTFWNAYSVYPLTISLMGINPVKDFDYTVYDSSILDFKSEYWYKRENDASTFNVYIAADSSKAMCCQGSFKIVEGLGNITIGNISFSYNAAGGSNVDGFNTFDSSAIIEAISDTIISYAVLDGSTVFKSYKEGESEEYLQDYYFNYGSSVGFYGATALKYGLTIPTVTKWNGIGNDCRNNPMRLILDGSIFDVSTNFIPYENAFDGELFYPSFKYLTPGSRNWKDYVFFDINDSIRYEEDGNTIYSSFKELMFDNTDIDIFSKLVYSNNNVDGTKLRSSIVYYNNYKNTIDTILNGLNLSFNIVENARNIIDIQDWDRYRIAAVAVPSRNRDNNSPMEVFINENTKTILLVWYQGNDILNYNYRYSSTMPGKGVLDPQGSNTIYRQFESFDNTDPHYSHVKTPFGVNNATLSSNIFNIYGIDSTYDGSIASPFAQNNLNFGDSLFSTFNAYNGNDVIGSSFEFYDRAYETFRQYVSYEYSRSESTYGDLVANQAYSYMRNDNLYQNNTCDWDTLKYILDYNRVDYYIFRGTTLYTSDSFSVNPVKITVNAPRTYKNVVTYNGWYKPSFNNILDFSYNEDKTIIDTVGKDFTFSNTDLKSYQDIPQLWFNKIVEQVTSYDVSQGNAIDYEKNYNPFLSQWDADYYYLYDTGVKSPVDGYNSTLELPSYFGSKLIKLPYELILNQWENTTTDEEYNTGRLSLSYNLTRSIVNIFKNKDAFINNWSDLTQSDNVIDGYIKTTILSYYNISKPKIKVDIWTKPWKGEASRLALTLDSSFTKWTGANIDGTLSFINNEYIYTVNIVPRDPLIYFVQFSLFEK